MLLHRVVTNSGSHGKAGRLRGVVFPTKCTHKHAPELPSQQAVEQEVGGGINYESCLPCIKDQDGGMGVGDIGRDGNNEIGGGQNAADNVAEGDAKHDVRQTCNSKNSDGWITRHMYRPYPLPRSQVGYG